MCDVWFCGRIRGAVGWIWKEWGALKGKIYISREGGGRWLAPLLFIELVGIIAGSFAAYHFRDSELLRRYIAPEIFGGTAFEIFFSTFLTALIFLLLSFFSGLSVFGQPVCAMLLLFLGAECSSSAALIYAENGASGIAEILTLYLPKTAALSAVGIFSAREGISVSTGIFRSMASSAEPPSLRKYCIRYALLTAAAIIISAADAVIGYFVGRSAWNGVCYLPIRTEQTLVCGCARHFK